MARKYIDCRDYHQADKRCSVAISADSTQELIEAAEHWPAPLSKFFSTGPLASFSSIIVKHAGVQKARISVSTSNGTVSLTVSDQGRGFNLQAIGNSTSGFGLLSIRERASYNGGSMNIESENGKGSRLTLVVPFQTPEATPATTMERLATYDAELELPTAKSTAGKMRVMFVDDHKVMRQGLILRLVTNQSDIKVVGEAANGREAVGLARLIRPDLIVMDVSIPEMDGIEATRRIKPEIPDIRVIGLSMQEDEHVSREIRDAGADAFICKTISAAELINVINHVAERIHKSDNP